MKAYTFHFVAQQAEFYPDGFYGVVYGGAATTLASEHKECTLQEAIAYLPEFSKAAPGPHAAWFAMSRIDSSRKPAGYKEAAHKQITKR